MAQGDDVGEGAPSVEAPPDVVDGTVSDSGDCGQGMETPTAYSMV